MGSGEKRKSRDNYKQNAPEEVNRQLLGRRVAKTHRESRLSGIQMRLLMPVRGEREVSIIILVGRVSCMT